MARFFCINLRIISISMRFEEAYKDDRPRAVPRVTGRFEMKMKKIAIAVAMMLGSVSAGYCLDSSEALEGDPPKVLPRVMDEQPADEAMEGAAPSVPALTFTDEGNKTKLEVDGVRWDQVEAIRLGSRDVTPVLVEALEGGQARVTSTPTGFALEFDDPALLGEDDGLFTLVLTTDTAVSVPVPARTLKALAATPQAACAWLTFSAPTKTAANGNCLYGSTNCAKPGYYHTAIDYTYSSSAPSAYVAADGKVVKVEKMSSGDHGMGNNVIIEHTLSNCNKVYSTYSHLASIDKAIAKDAKVKRGQQVGVMGGSGYGNSSYWRSKHLHFEVKTKPVSGTPQSYNETCKSGCWGYTPHWPDGYGYSSPRNFY